MSRMTPIGLEPDPRGIDRNDKQAMADYRKRLADFKKRENAYNKLSAEEKKRYQEKRRKQNEQRSKDKPREREGQGGKKFPWGSPGDPDYAAKKKRYLSDPEKRKRYYESIGVKVKPKPKPGGSGSVSGPRRSCPDPNMFILMADGSQKKAGDLKVGDLVKTYDEKDLEREANLARYRSLVLASGDVEENFQLKEQLENSYAKASLGEYKVEFVDIIKNVEKIKLFFEGSEIVCSLTHKFYVNNSWKEAKDMVVGDEVSGKKLLSTQSVEDGDVVHITIEDAHTYICEGLLSHNKRYGGRRSTPTTPKPGGKPKKKKGMRARLLAARRRRALLAARRRRMREKRRRLNERRSGGMLGGRRRRRTGGRRSGAIRNRRVRSSRAGGRMRNRSFRQRRRTRRRR